ncbi:MAG: hypothetical protein ACYTGB_07935 [Planctomycetota bacterium]|jgi:type II secretory pathway component PulM
MSKAAGEIRSSGHPEIFWILFLLVSAGVFLTVVEPARRETAAARRRLARARRDLAALRQRIAVMRRDRRALERGDPEAWRAAISAAGLRLPGTHRLAATGRQRHER